MLKREELTAERIEEIVSDARKAGYDFFLSAEERAASLKEAMTRYQPGDEACRREARNASVKPRLVYRHCVFVGHTC